MGRLGKLPKRRHPEKGLDRHGRPKNVAKIAKIEENPSKPCPEGSVIKDYNLRNSPFPDLREHYNGNVRPRMGQLRFFTDCYDDRHVYRSRAAKSAPYIKSNEYLPEFPIF